MISNLPILPTLCVKKLDYVTFETLGQFPLSPFSHVDLLSLFFYFST